MPWLITVLGVIVACILSLIPNQTDLQTYIYLSISSIIFLIGLIAIFATIGKKRKIRIANDITITKNPYTWFLSKIGKITCGTIIFILGIGIFVLIAIFTTSVSKSLSSGSTSSNRTTSESSGTSNFSGRTSSAPKMYWYICKSCAICIKKPIYLPPLDVQIQLFITGCELVKLVK